MIKILKYKNDKAAFHECRASKKLLNDIFKFPEGLCLPCLTRKTVPQCWAAIGKTPLIMVRLRQWNF